MICNLEDPMSLRHPVTWYVTRLMHICDMTYSHVWQGLSMCLTWLIHVCCMNLWYVSLMYEDLLCARESVQIFLLQCILTRRSWAKTRTHCDALQHTATHSLLQCIWARSSWARTATHCNTLQHTATRYLLQHTLTRSSRARTATQCNTLQHVVKHCNALQLNIRVIQGKAHGKVEKNRFRWRQWEAPTCW